jgi:hypothetical protein
MDSKENALLDTADRSLYYYPSKREDIISSLLKGGRHLFYGPGGTGKTYEAKEIRQLLAGRGYRVHITTLANEAALRFGGTGIYQLFGLTVDKKSGGPRSKLDDLCMALRRSNPGQSNDERWDGVTPSNSDLKDYQYMRRYTLRPDDHIERMTDLEIVSKINLSRARYKQLDCAQVLDNMRRTSVFIFEECFMIGSKLLTFVDAQLRKYRDNDLPFGGAGIILSGDALQIEPIKDNYIFETSMWNSLKLQVHLFHEYKRFDTNDLSFLSFLRRARIGELTREDIQLLRGRRRSVVADSSVYRLCRTRKEADDTNAAELKKLQQLGLPKYSITARDSYYKRHKTEKTVTDQLLHNPNEIADAKRLFGDTSLLTNLKDVLAVTERARIIITHNDQVHQLYNGFTGVVERIVHTEYNASKRAGENKSGSIELYVTLDRTFTYNIKEVTRFTHYDTTKLEVGSVVSLEKCICRAVDCQFCSFGSPWMLTEDSESIRQVRRSCKIIKIDNEEFRSIDTVLIPAVTVESERGIYVVKRYQYPFVLGWGKTVHKAQGDTLTEGVVILHGRLAAGAAYVACSRFRNIDDLVIEDGYDPAVFYANSRALEFDRLLQETGRYTYVVEDDAPQEDAEEREIEMYDMDEELRAFLVS